jgi:hypothetical protein
MGDGMSLAIENIGASPQFSADASTKASPQFSALQICTAYKAPVEPSPAENSSFHEIFLSSLNAEAELRGWGGSAVCQYVRIDGYLSISIEPGKGWATMKDLRDFRERQRQAQREEPEQGRLV